MKTSDKIFGMLKKAFRFIFKWTLIIGGLVAIGVLLPRTITTVSALQKMHSSEESPSAPVAIVYGAGLRRDGGPALVLRRRIEAAVTLYEEGKVDTLLMSGMAPEPIVMKNYAIQLGVPEEDILMDKGGLRTYDTCYRAKEVFGLEDVILVTQEFHLPRALYLCNAMGLDAQGVYAYEGNYWRGAMVFWQIRETLATLMAFSDLYITHPIPAFNEPNTLIPEES